MHIHILGICGTFMGGLAALARAAGHRVTGCDAGVYPPMSDQLRALGIDLIEGYSADQLALQPDLYVIGNVVSRARLAGLKIHPRDSLPNRTLTARLERAWMHSLGTERERIGAWLSRDRPTPAIVIAPHVAAAAAPAPAPQAAPAPAPPVAAPPAKDAPPLRGLTPEGDAPGH